MCQPMAGTSFFFEKKPSCAILCLFSIANFNHVFHLVYFCRCIAAFCRETISSLTIRFKKGCFIILLDSNTTFYIFILFLLFLFLFPFYLREKKKQKIKKQIHELAKCTLEMSPKEFMSMRKYSLGGRGHKSYARTMNFAGVYILHNKTKDLYYVGQGKKALDRVNSHFTGKGNGDVYADYKYGDTFSIKMIALADSGFSTLNELERNTIMAYDAYNKGYNKTRGNVR